MNEERSIQIDPEQMNDPELCREIGKKLYFEEQARLEDRSYGLSLLNRAAALNDDEAKYIIGFLLVSGAIKYKESDSVEHGLRLICSSANHGFMRARHFLNQYTDDKYSKDILQKQNTNGSCKGPLKDFDGKVISINRTGALTPIDAVLEYTNGENVLTLSANIVFSCNEVDLPDADKFYNAVVDGMMQWQGEYRVFGNQCVKVKLNLTFEDRIFDNVLVIPMTGDFQKMVGDFSSKIGTKAGKENIGNLFEQKRSFAVSGVKKWSVKSRKIICIFSENDRFDDYEEIKHVAKHEFGHALGLGDLYYSPVDNLSGVEKGMYQELDSYYVGDKIYNLVMCDHHGPISNNDIEMVILAFSENCMQNYQPSKAKGKISNALGRGN